MGCTTSAVSPDDQEDQKTSKKAVIVKNSKQDIGNRHQNGDVKKLNSNNSSSPWKTDKVDTNGNKISQQSLAPVFQRGVAFDVTLDGISNKNGMSVNKPPSRLQVLEPLSVPRLTTEQLQEKQRLADEKREKLRQRKINISQKSSRRRRDLIEARQFELKQLSEQENDVIDNNKLAELKREQHLIEIREKQKLREEKAKRTRERAKQLQEPEDLEVEKDEEFNSASDDTWLGLPDQSHTRHPEEEHEPHKRLVHIRPSASAQSVDSYDAAFMRSGTSQNKVSQPSHGLQHNAHNFIKDDFFDS